MAERAKKKKHRRRRIRKWLFSNRAATGLVSLLAGWLIRFWLGTMRYRFVAQARTSNPAWAERPTLYVFWHEMLLFPAYTHARYVSTLVSQHRDGELLTQMLRKLGGRTVRGSSSEGSTSAVRGLIRVGRRSHLAIAPDGPHGPRRIAQPGAVFLAARSGMPIVPVGFAFSRCWRARTWDRLAIPRPGHDAWAVAGEPLEIPAHLSRLELDRHVARVQSALEAVQAEAERLAAGGRTTDPVLTWRQVLGD